MNRSAARSEKKRKSLNSETNTTVYRDSLNGTFSSTSSFITKGDAIPPRDTDDKSISQRYSQIDRAVWAHIKALRALGRDQINSIEIAEALNLPLFVIHASIERLKPKGVKQL